MRDRPRHPGVAEVHIEIAAQRNDRIALADLFPCRADVIGATAHVPFGLYVAVMITVADPASARRTLLLVPHDGFFCPVALDSPVPFMHLVMLGAGFAPAHTTLAHE